MIKFNPIKNKYPQGALKNNDDFYFEVFIKDDFYFNDFKIIIKNIIFQIFLFFLRNLEVLIL